MGFGVESPNAKMINIDILLTVLNGYFWKTNKILLG